MRTIDLRNLKPDAAAEFLDKPLLQDNTGVEEIVRSIIADVRARGDAAVFSYIRRFDWPDADSLVVPDEDIDRAYGMVSNKLLAAIRVAKANIEDFHKRQLRSSWTEEVRPGRTLGQVVRPLERVGVLAPGFQAPLPSSVLMGAVPARVAGVSEVFLCTPPRNDGSIHPAIAVAAREAGIDRILRIGGAHGVAAMAWGTESVPRVDKIVGPGNVYVAMAKRFVFGQVGIDMLAGPSEVMVLADGEANPAYIAADLLSQAEHDKNARSILVTTSAAIAEEVAKEVELQLSRLSRESTARESLEQNGAIVLVSSLEDGISLVNRVAPEHLELAVENPMSILDSIRNAGAIFMGGYAAEPIGDYVAGPNHTLPTSGTARFASPLSVDDFTKKSSIIMYTRKALLEEAPAAIELAEAEGLDAHANSLKIRIDGGK